MLAKIGFFAALPFVLILGMVLTTDTLVVDVREGGPGGTHIVIPVPMVLARVAVNFVPEGDRSITCEELWRYREPLRKVLAEIRNIPDGELVRVKDGGDDVRIAKVGNMLAIHVEEDMETRVDVKVPLKAVDRFLARLDGETFEAKDLLASFNNTMHGELIHVQDGDDEVRITVW